jgi:hypothetical protein
MLRAVGGIIVDTPEKAAEGTVGLEGVEIGRDRLVEAAADRPIGGTERVDGLEPVAQFAEEAVEFGFHVKQKAADYRL